MKNFKNKYKTANTIKQATSFWLSLLQWLKLLVLSYTRERKHPPGIYFHDPGDLVFNKKVSETNYQNQLERNNKLSIMKSLKRHIKWGVLLLLLIISATKGIAQGGPYLNTG